MGLLKLVAFVAIVAAFAVGGIYVFMAAGQEAHRLNHTATESATVTLDEWNALSESNVPGAAYADDERILNASGAELVEDTDYQWNTSTGEIRPLSGTDATTSITATYNYTAPSNATQTGLTILPNVPVLLSILGIVGGAFVVIIGVVLILAAGVS